MVRPTGSMGLVFPAKSLRKFPHRHAKRHCLLYDSKCSWQAGITMLSGSIEALEVIHRHIQVPTSMASLMFFPFLYHLPPFHIRMFYYFCLSSFDEEVIPIGSGIIYYYILIVQKNAVHCGILFYSVYAFWSYSPHLLSCLTYHLPPHGPFSLPC